MITYMNSVKESPTIANEEFWQDIHATYTEDELKEVAPLRAIVYAHDLKIRLAKEIKAKREELKLTQRELAKLANISQREISFLEQAKGNQTLASVSRVLFILDLQLEIRT